MGMRINQNIAAMNSYRNLSVTEGQLSKSLEKLSSGFRINRAADDAAGLAISEKLRGQVNGLNTASSNAQNGISLIQTAEGALNESHSILQRMRELAVQSANDTNTDDDRAQIQKEVNQLTKELTRIGDSTEFNTKKLLDGSFTNAVFQIGANEGQTLNVSVTDVRATALGLAGAVTTTATGGGSAGSPATSGTVTGSAAPVALSANSTLALSVDGGAVVNVALARGDAAATVVGKINTALGYTAASLDPTSGALVLTSSTTGSTSSMTVDASSTASALTELALTAGQTGTGTDAVAPVAASTTTLTNTGLESGTYSVASAVNAAGTYDVSDGTNVVGTFDGTTIRDASGNSLATVANAPAAGTAWSFEVGGFDISSSSAVAQGAITTIQSAIDNVSGQRASLGAIQNRLDHTINNLGVAAENLAASESRIRDTDMAAEMMKFTRAQILSQAGTSMLAQANQLPQGVLGLLR